MIKIVDGEYNMKKIFMGIGAILIVLLMVSSATAVNLTHNDDVFEETVDEEESNTAEEPVSRSSLKGDVTGNAFLDITGTATLKIHATRPNGDDFVDANVFVFPFPFFYIGWLFCFAIGLYNSGKTNGAGECTIEIDTFTSRSWPFWIRVIGYDDTHLLPSSLGRTKIEMQAGGTYDVDVQCWWWLVPDIWEGIIQYER